MLGSVLPEEGAGRFTAPVLGSSPDDLSDREVEVLRLLATELTGPQIALQLFVSVNTLRTHTRHIFTKLGVGTGRPDQEPRHDHHPCPPHPGRRRPRRHRWADLRRRPDQPPPMEVASAATTDWVVRSTAKAVMAPLVLIGVAGMYLLAVGTSATLSRAVLSESLWRDQRHDVVETKATCTAPEVALGLAAR